MFDLNKLWYDEKYMDTAYKCRRGILYAVFYFMLIECSLFATSQIKFRVAHIKVFAVKFFLNQAEAFTETLEMHDFALAQKTDRFTDFRIFDKT